MTGFEFVVLAGALTVAGARTSRFVHLPPPLTVLMLAAMVNFVPGLGPYTLRPVVLRADARLPESGSRASAPANEADSRCSRWWC